MKTYIILNNVRSAHNVGSIFRTADGSGVSKIFLTGYTPAPTDRFGRTNEEIKKTSLGATDFVAWEIVEDLEALFEKLKKEGVSLVAVEQKPYAVDYRSYVPAGDIAYVFGNEVDGVPDKICTAADATIHIPLYGKKESLNVSVCAGIILFRTVSRDPNTQRSQ